MAAMNLQKQVVEKDSKIAELEIENATFKKKIEQLQTALRTSEKKAAQESATWKQSDYVKGLKNDLENSKKINTKAILEKEKEIKESFQGIIKKHEKQNEEQTNLVKAKTEENDLLNAQIKQLTDQNKQLSDTVEKLNDHKQKLKDKLREKIQALEVKSSQEKSYEQQMLKLKQKFTVKMNEIQIVVAKKDEMIKELQNSTVELESIIEEQENTHEELELKLQQALKNAQENSSSGNLGEPQSLGTSSGTSPGKKNKRSKRC